MGFYGNITNVNKSTFQFDKTYSNARDALEKAKTDGVFVGRYILIDYDAELNMSSVFDAIQGNEELLEKWGASNFLPAYKLYIYDDGNGAYSDGSVNGIMQYNESYGFYAGKPTIIDGKMNLDSVPKYTSNQLSENNYLLVLGHIKKKNIVDPATYEIQESEVTFDYNIVPELWVVENNGGLQFRRLDQLEVNEKYGDLSELITNHYIENYEIDRAYFLTKSGGQSLGRGYDSTVWQKVIKNGEMTYAMIAELNSVVPTFDVTVDRPTPAPRAPYWDSDTSNLYYKLHVQPSWGMRVKEKDEGNNYLSDINNEAIYWNQAGFNKFIPSTIDLENLPNRILVEPTGVSGNRYWTGAGVTATAPDIYELSIALPQIGNIISELWDLIYGTAKEYDTLGNALWNKDINAPVFANDERLMRNTNLEWNTRNGERAYKKWKDTIDPVTGDVIGGATVTTYNKDALDNLAGVINSTHDLMGMIIVEPEIENFNQATYNAESLSENNIYYINGKYYFKNKKYTISDDITDDYGIRGTDMVDLLDPNSETVYYNAKTLMLDKYTNKGESYQNYYKVTAPIIEGEQYGTLETVGVDISPETWQSRVDSLLEKQEINSGTGKTILRYIPVTDEKPIKGKKYYTFDNAAAARVDEISIPVFYERSKYYIGKKIFTQEEVDNNTKAAWEEKTTIAADDFDSLYLAVGTTIAEAKTAAGITNEETLGYKWLKGVKLDPNETRWSYIDVNSKKESVSVNDSHLVPVFAEESAEEIVGYKYQAFGVEADLQGWKKNDDILEYTITVFKDKNNHIPETIEDQGETIVVNTLKTLKEWVEWWEINQDETPLDLVPEQNIQRVISEPAYTLEEASVIPETNLVEFNNGISNYYVKHYTFETPPKLTEYLQITQADFSSDEISSGNAEIYLFEDERQPQEAPIYYNVENDYYFKDEDNNFIRETATILRGDQAVIENKYYEVTWTPLNKILFVPNTYYYDDGTGNYVLAETFDSSKTYYRYPGTFVHSDDNNVRAQGAEWNKYVNEIPEGVTLGKKSSTWQLTELPGFADDINTLHGLILKVNKILLAGDVLTRDRATVQGAINTLNDIIDKFDQLIPSEIVMVDLYGRIHSGDWDSKQKFGYTNIGKPTASQAIPTGEPVAADDERWVKLTTTPGIAPDFKPHIKLEHTLKHSVAPTTTTANKNADEPAGDGLNAAYGDTIDLYTPVVDNMGHIIGKNTETVTLPYGFKFIKIGQPISNEPIDAANPAAGDTVDELAAAGRLRADNTQDEFTINPSNKWIRIKGTDTEINGELITIGHEIHEINEDPNGITDLNGANVETLPTGTDVINIPDWDYDDAGHIIEKHNHHYMLPYGFKKVGVKNTTAALSEGVWNTTLDSDAVEIIADNSQDIVNIETDEWINIATTDAEGNDKLVFTHRYPYQERNTTSLSNLNSPLSNTINLETVVLDDAGHVKHVNTETVTLPYGFKTITGNNGSLVADNTQDTIALSGDNWIQTTASSEGVAIIHIGPVTVPERNVASVTPNFGDTFTIEDWRFDEKGHKAGVETHTVEMPDLELVSVNPAISGNVVTALTIANNANNDGKVFTKTEANVGTLQLTGYSLSNNGIVETAIEATDTINTAFGRLEYRLNKEITDRTDAITAANTALTNAIEGLDADLDANGTLQHNGTFVISGVTEANGIITAVDSVEVEAAGAAAAALTTAIGSASDASTADTINGAKAYADSLAINYAANDILTTTKYTFAIPVEDESNPGTMIDTPTEKTIQEWIEWIIANK